MVRLGVVLVCAASGLACSYPGLPRIGQDDGGVDSAAVTDRLTFNLQSIKLSRRQAVPIHVQRIRTDGTTVDVTAAAVYRSSDDAIVTSIAPGMLSSGTRAGTATIIASLPDAATGTLTITVTGVACHPVVNEVRSASPIDPNDEWVELYNPCLDAFYIAGWTLNYRDAPNTGANDSSLLQTLSGSLLPGDLRLYVGPGYLGSNFDGRWPTGVLSVASSSVGLRSGPITTGPLVDAVAYGLPAGLNHPFSEGAPMPMLASTLSAARQPFDGNDTDDNAADFVISTTATPRAPNAP